MSWAPRACPPCEERNHSFKNKKGAFFIAVANDDGDVSILLVSSPYSNMSISWNCTVIKLIQTTGDALVILPKAPACSDETRLSDIVAPPQFQTSQDGLGESNNGAHFHPSLFKFALQEKKFIDHIVWGPWRFGEGAETIITFSRCGTFFHCLFEVQFQVSQYGVMTQVLSFECRRFLKQEIDSAPFSSCSAMWHSQVIIHGRCSFVSS